MQKSKSHSFVIFPSSVRSIPFTVPTLSSASSHFRLLEGCSGGGVGLCTPSSAVRSIQRRPSPFSSSSDLRRHDPDLVTSAAAAAAADPPSDLTEERPGAGAGGERWASEPCCLEGSSWDATVRSGGGRTNNNNNPTATATAAALRRNKYGLSCDSIASHRTIDLENANLLCGIDPSLYLSTESGLDAGSIGGLSGRGGGGGDQREDGEEDELEDDDFYSGVYDDSNIGRIWFSLNYDPETERLCIRLIRIRNLPNSLIASHSARDPVVRIWLMPDERRWVQAKFKRKTRNPRFNENFAFQVSVRDFADRSIKLTVFGSADRHNRRQVAFGHVIYHLRDHVYEPNERIIIWRDLERESTMLLRTNEEAQLYVSLSYNSQLSRLNVAVHSGKNFPPSDDHERPSNEFYVVVSLMEMSKVVKKKKTPVVKQSINFSPIFNDLFQFKVKSTSLDVTSLLVTAMRHVPFTGHKDKSIGRLVLGSFMFARGQELDHWNAMLANEKEQIPKWHTLTN